ncbi:hypothetical protein DPX16_19762 [Anabarilius grahami]|uniref:Uncharacterized protein n=1 Tax=Anabarilius grahami TaxID=495550 RepID=A0A3N0XQ62_ANAGA|nr:hypothetical protein DPX16_19762 [Anabarilius grahami]
MAAAIENTHKMAVTTTTQSQVTVDLHGPSQVTADLPRARSSLRRGRSSLRRARSRLRTRARVSSRPRSSSPQAHSGLRRASSSPPRAGFLPTMAAHEL